MKIGYLGNKKLLVKKISKNNNGRIQLIEAETERERLILLNPYNSNSETEQLLTLSDVSLLLSDFYLYDTKNHSFAGNFNSFFKQKLEALGEKPILKKKSISKLLQIFKKYNLIDVPKPFIYTFYF